jgi:hypothetical protein
MTLLGGQKMDLYIPCTRCYCAIMLGLVRIPLLCLDHYHEKFNCKCLPVQALPFSDALKLMSYLKDWTSHLDKVGLSAL